MQITLEEYKRAISNYTIVDCVVRNKNMFTFIASRYYTDEEVEQEEADGKNPSYRDKKVIPFMRHKEVGDQWSFATLHDWHTLRGGASLIPKDQFVGIDLDGKVFTAGSGVIGREDDIPGFKQGGPDRGGMRKLKTINGWLYACGGARSLGKRLDKDKWISFTQLLEKHPEIGRGGFDDFDGFSEQDIYAAGGRGDVWHFDGSHWNQITFPTNEVIKSVCCGGDGVVYISCYEGLTFAGRGSQWKKIYGGGITQGFRDMVWHDNRVWCTNDYGLWTIHNNKLESADVASEVKVCSGHLYVNDGILLLAGLGGAAFLENDQWNVLFNRATMEKMLYEKQQQK